MKEKLEKFNLPGLIIQVKEQKSGTFIEGYASVFQLKDRQEDTVDPAGLEQVMQEYMLNPVLAANHENSVFATVGQIVKYRIDKIGLWIRAKLSDSTDEATQTVVQKIKEGALRALSIWGDWTRDKAGVINIKDLYHIGVVQVPANSLCVFALAKMLSGEDIVCTECSDCYTKTEEEKMEGQKPYPGEHSCRLRDPGDFQGDSFRRTTREHEGKPYAIIMGKLEGETTMTEQAYRYSTSDWDEGQARNHCEGHDGNFEAAVLKAKELTEQLAAIDARLATIEEKLEPKKEEPKPEPKPEDTPPPVESLPNLTEEALREQIAQLETRVAQLTTS